jgi:hypothetical protein
MKSNSVGSLIHVVLIAVLFSRAALNRVFFHGVMTPEAVCAGGTGLLTVRMTLIVSSLTQEDGVNSLPRHWWQNINILGMSGSMIENKDVQPHSPKNSNSVWIIFSTFILSSSAGECGCGKTEDGCVLTPR